MQGAGTEGREQAQRARRKEVFSALGQVLRGTTANDDETWLSLPLRSHNDREITDLWLVLLEVEEEEGVEELFIAGICDIPTHGRMRQEDIHSISKPEEKKKRTEMKRKVPESETAA